MKVVRLLLVLYLTVYLLPADATANTPEQERTAVTFALNTSIISGYGLSLPDMIRLTAEAGFSGIEIWTQDVEDFIQHGGSLEQLAALIRESGLSVENLIGFAPCVSEDETLRQEGVKQFRKELEYVKALDGKHIAVTGAGLQEAFSWDRLDHYARQYKEILDICNGTGVRPLLELWGSHHLSRVEYITAILMRTGRTDGALLLDLYHLYRGGNSWESLSVLHPSVVPVIHINDYPGNIPYTELTDADRVMTGEGICPTKQIFDLLQKKGFQGVISVELFNESYWATYTPQELLAKIMSNLQSIYK